MDTENLPIWQAFDWGFKDNPIPSSNWIGYENEQIEVVAWYWLPRHCLYKFEVVKETVLIKYENKKSYLHKHNR